MVSEPDEQLRGEDDRSADISSTMLIVGVVLAIIAVKAVLFFVFVV